MRRVVQLFLCIGFLFTAFLSSAQAQSADTPSGEPPEAIVGSIYALYEGDGLGAFPTDPDVLKLFSARTRLLLEEDDKLAQRDGIGRLDFDVFVDAQDWDLSEVSISKPEVSGETAVVDASFRNFDEQRTLRYLFVNEDGSWLIDDIVSESVDYPWSLTAILAGN